MRIIHWLIVILVVFSWATAEFGHLYWRSLSGYVILGLVLFRIYWGFFGSTTARFSHFLRGPRAVLKYARNLGREEEQSTVLGHNPMGGWSVAALIVLLLAQIIFGLFSVDVDGLESGPLASYVSFDAGRRAAAVHETIFSVLQLFIFLHIEVVFSYLIFAKMNLIAPMITGTKKVPSLSYRVYNSHR